MAFFVPEMPLAVAVYDGPWLAKAYRFSTVCNLAPGVRTYPFVEDFDPESQPFLIPTTVLFPAHSDIRDWSTGAPSPDILEIPEGSGRWYCVVNVDDLGKGFSNEHRVVIAVKIFFALNAGHYFGLEWPTPIP